MRTLRRPAIRTELVSARNSLQVRNRYIARSLAHVPDLRHCTDRMVGLSSRRVMSRTRCVSMLVSIMLVGAAPLLGQRPARVEFFAGYSYSNMASTTRHSFNGAQGHIKLNLNSTVG